MQELLKYNYTISLYSGKEFDNTELQNVKNLNCIVKYS
jgi:hypothetical protein